MHSNTCRIKIWALGLGLAAWLLMALTGCCGKQVERDYGHSVTHNLALSLVDPTAGQEVYVSRGQSPDAAANAYVKYNKTFSPEEKKPVYRLTTGEGY